MHYAFHSKSPFQIFIRLHSSICHPSLDSTPFSSHFPSFSEIQFKSRFNRSENFCRNYIDRSSPPLILVGPLPLLPITFHALSTNHHPWSPSVMSFARAAYHVYPQTLVLRRIDRPDSVCHSAPEYLSNLEENLLFRDDLLLPLTEDEREEELTGWKWCSVPHMVWTLSAGLPSFSYNTPFSVPDFGVITITECFKVDHIAGVVWFRMKNIRLNPSFAQLIGLLLSESGSASRRNVVPTVHLGSIGVRIDSGFLPSDVLYLRGAIAHRMVSPLWKPHYSPIPLLFPAYSTSSGTSPTSSSQSAPPTSFRRHNWVIYEPSASSKVQSGHHSMILPFQLHAKLSSTKWHITLPPFVMLIHPIITGTPALLIRLCYYWHILSR